MFYFLVISIYLFIIHCCLLIFDFFLPHNFVLYRTLSAMDRGFPSLAAHSHVEGASTRTSGGGSGTHSMTDRPSSALARGVQITDYSETKVNPDPIMLEESEVLLEEYLSPRKLVLTRKKSFFNSRVLLFIYFSLF